METTPNKQTGLLALGGITAVLASSCCLGPLLLVFLGFTGTWIGSLAVLEPYRPLFLILTLAALFFAARRIFRRAPACEPNSSCATPTASRTTRIIFFLVSALALVAFAFPYAAPLFY